MAPPHRDSKSRSEDSADANPTSLNCKAVGVFKVANRKSVVFNMMLLSFFVVDVSFNGSTSV